MSARKVNVAIVGLGFGTEFIPIYQRHPNARMYASIGIEWGAMARLPAFTQ